MVALHSSLVLLIPANYFASLAISSGQTLVLSWSKLAFYLPAYSPLTCGKNLDTEFSAGKGPKRTFAS